MHLGFNDAHTQGSVPLALGANNNYPVKAVYKTGWSRLIKRQKLSGTDSSAVRYLMQTPAE